MKPVELKCARIRHGKTAMDMANLIGVSGTAWLCRERGDTQVSLEEAATISRALDLDENEFAVIFFDGKLPYRKIC